MQLTSIYLIPSHPISSDLFFDLLYLSLTVHFSAFLPIVHPFSSDFSGPGSPGLAVAPRVGARSGPSMAPSDTCWTPTWWLLQGRNHVEIVNKKKHPTIIQPSPTKRYQKYLGSECSRLRHEAMAPGLLVEKPISSTALVRVTRPLKNITAGGRRWSHRPGFRQGPKVQGHLTSQRPYGGWHWWSVKA